MKKSNDAKYVNRQIRKFNRELVQDVFADRFWIRQYQKARVDGMDYFLYELRDRVQPERNYVIPYWVNVYDASRKVFREMNDFIIFSNFWSIYYNQPDRYNIDNDSYLKEKN